MGIPIVPPDGYIAHKGDGGMWTLVQKHSCLVMAKTNAKTGKWEASERAGEDVKGWCLEQGSVEVPVKEEEKSDSRNDATKRKRRNEEGGVVSESESAVVE